MLPPAIQYSTGTGTCIDTAEALLRCAVARESTACVAHGEKASSAMDIPSMRQAFVAVEEERRWPCSKVWRSVPTRPSSAFRGVPWPRKVHVAVFQVAAHRRRRGQWITSI